MTTEKDTPTSETDILAMKNALQLADVAVSWWVARRPDKWSLEQHYKNPFINCLTPSEKNLAIAISTYCRANQKQEKKRDQKK